MKGGNPSAPTQRIQRSKSMSVQIDIEYTGNLHCTATHVDSKTTLNTDAPIDNRGKGEAFSPTDLVATALGTCIMTIMGMFAERNKVNLVGTKINVTKEMADAPLRRIGKLKAIITFPKGLNLSVENKRKFENTVNLCPVKQSLHPDVKVETKFVYQ